MKVRELPLDKIQVGKRFRTEFGNIKDLAESLKEKGLIQPISVDENFNLLAGGRRYVAAQEAGLKKIPAVIRKTIDDLDAREVELFENIHRKDMTWQENLNLTAEIHKLMLEKYGEGWTQQRTADLLGASRSAVQDSVELAEAMEHIPEIADASTADQARKTYKRLIEKAIISDALSEAKGKTQKQVVKWANDHYKIGDVLKSIGVVADEVINFAEVDPPYGIDLKGKRKHKGEHLKNYNEIEAKDYPDFIRSIAKQVFRVLRAPAFCVWWYGPSWHDTVKEILLDVGFTLDEIPAIWYKPGGGVTNAPDSYLARQYEPFFVCRKGNATLRERGRGNVFPFPGVPPTQRIHSTERPVELIQEILRAFVLPGARIIVPFLGSGNTIIAGYKEGMLPFGWDLSQEHKDGFLARVAKEFPDDFNIQEADF